MARYSEAQNRATQKYIKNNYDVLTIRAPKGKRETYKAYAEEQGKSLNQLVIELLENTKGGNGDMAEQEGKKFWIETDYENNTSIALHEKTDDYDEIVWSSRYADVPEYDEEMDLDEKWQVIDAAIKNSIGYVPDYEIN